MWYNEIINSEVGRDFIARVLAGLVVVTLVTPVVWLILNLVYRNRLRHKDELIEHYKQQEEKDRVYKLFMEEKINLLEDKVNELQRKQYVTEAVANNVILFGMTWSKETGIIYDVDTMMRNTVLKDCNIPVRALKGKDFMGVHQFTDEAKIQLVAAREYLVRKPCYLSPPLKVFKEGANSYQLLNYMIQLPSEEHIIKTIPVEVE